MAIQETKVGPIPISGLAHIGIRVHDLERSVRFYELLGFTKTAGPIGPEPVAILDHPSGIEVNLVLNAPSANEPNVLMDVPEKHPGITHFALLCQDIMAAKERLEAAGIPLSGGPVRFGPGAQGIFLRDPHGDSGGVLRRISRRTRAARILARGTPGCRARRGRSLVRAAAALVQSRCR